MSTEIKLKAWLPSLQRMTKCLTLDEWFNAAPFGTTPVWLQFIGLQDNSSTDIYDGDILYESSSSRRFLIMYVNEMAGFGYKEITKGNKKFDGRIPVPKPCRKYLMAMLQVIGNKYENHSLTTP